MNYFPSVKWGTARQTPTLTNDNQQYYGWSLKVYTSKMLPFKKKRKQTFIDSHKHTPQTHKYQYICCMVYMRYSLCLIFYCIQYGTAQTLNSEVQAQERPTGAWNSQSFHTFFIREEEAQEEEKESFLSTRGNSGQVNSHPVWLMIARLSHSDQSGNRAA